MGLTQITTGGVDNDINIDSNTLKVDGTNNRVGVNTASPGYALHAVGTIAARDSGTNTDIRLIPGSQQGSYSINSDTAQHIFVSGSNERMRIDSSGNVGINTTSPNSLLSVKVADARQLDVIKDSGDDNLVLKCSAPNASNNLRTIELAGERVAFSTGVFSGTTYTERMRIDSSGNVGIGVTSVAEKLHVGGGTNDRIAVSGSGSSGLVFENSSGTALFQIVYDDASSDNAFITTSDNLIFRNQGGTQGGTITERMRIDTSGRLLINTTNGVELISGVGGGLKLARNTSGSPTSGQSLMSVGFHGIDDTNSNAAAEAKIEAFAAENHSGTTAASDLRFYTKPSGTGPGSAPSERLRIDSSGKINIGTTSATQKVSVGTSASETIGYSVDWTGAGAGQVASFTANTSTGEVRIGATNSAGTYFPTFYSNNSERMRIDSSGDVLIGTTSNAAHANADNLIVGSTSGTHQGITINGSSSSQIRFADSANNSIGYLIYNHGSNKLEFGVNGGEAMIITKNKFVQTGGYVNNSASYHRFNGINQTQGTTFAVFSGYQTSGGSSGDTAYFYSCNSGTGPNGAGTAMAVFRHALTSRSINTSGTINASGADYAEYMTKAGNFTLAKGDICGINSEGKLTNVFADAISFVVKSTDPSYVGGDTWHTAVGEKPGGAGDDRTEEEIAAATVVYEEALETARQLVDRIAFSGQVPVNVTGATPGQHIIPTAAADGSIGGTAKAEADLTMAEYMSSVGKVIAIEDDGRAKIIVKVA